MSEEIEAKIEDEADWYGSAGTGGTPKSHFKDGAGSPPKVKNQSSNH